MSKQTDTQKGPQTTCSSIPSYPSAHIALAVMMDEYTKEESRQNIIENKVITLITLLIAFLTLYIPLIPWDSIPIIYHSGIPVKMLLLTVLLICCLVTLLYVTYTFIQLISIINLRTYFRVNIDNVANEELFCYDEDAYQAGLCQHYKELVIKNTEINDKKCKTLAKCFRHVVISFLFLLLSCIGLNIL